MRRVRDIPPVIQAALRDVHRLRRQRRPYSEVAAALDAVAAMPEASHPDVTEVIALERLDLIGRCPATDEEVERVLAPYSDVLAAMPAHERATTLRKACWARPELAERYLAPLLAEVESREPGDPSRTAEMLRHALAVARGEAQVCREAPAERVPEDYVDGIRSVLRLGRMGWPYEDVVAELDELSARLGSLEYTGFLARDRLILANWYERPDEELDELLQAALRVLEGESAQSRLSLVSSACVGRPALAEKYMPPLISELEEDLRRDPDQAGGQQALEAARRSYERTRGRA